MLDIPFWKRLLILGLVALGLLYAMPNLFYSRVEQHNDAVTAAERNGFESQEDVAARAGWPDWLPSGLVNLGLDLRGGAHLLGEVHVRDVYKARMDALWPELRDALAAQRDVVGAVRRVQAPEGQLAVEIGNPDQMAKAVEIARGLGRDIGVGGFGHVSRLSPPAPRQAPRRAHRTEDPHVRVRTASAAGS